MKIAVIGHIRHAIAEPFMGGMEAHCAQLAAGLRAAGHAVELFAAHGSDDPRLRVICAQPYEEVLPWDRHRGTPALDDYQRRAFATAWDAIAGGGFDVVHNNSLFPDLIDWARGDRVPMVTSQHVPPFGRMREAVERAAADGRAQITVASASQLPLWFDDPPANMRVVHNGIDCSGWNMDTPRGDHAVWFGRITPNKGLRLAVRAARLAGIPLRIAGHVEDRAYFEQQVGPLMDDTVTYRGHLSGDALRGEIASARIAVVTPMWDEPFGLVAAEALAAGLPVAAFDRGALREVVGRLRRRGAGRRCRGAGPRDTIGAFHIARTVPRTGTRTLLGRGDDRRLRSLLRSGDRGFAGAYPFAFRP